MVAVNYQQYAYRDTREPASYQLACVLHPASLWDDFGPIHLEVQVPKGVRCRASVPLSRRQAAFLPTVAPIATTAEVHAAGLDQPEQKEGELLFGVDQGTWDAFAASRDQFTAGQ